MTGALRFSQPPDGSGALRLGWRCSGAAVPDPPAAGVAVDVPLDAADAWAGVAVALVCGVAVDVPMDDFAAADAPALLAYVSGAQRPTVGMAGAAWQLARPGAAGAALVHQGARTAPVGWAARWQRGQAAPAPVVHRLPDVLRGLWWQGSAPQQDAGALRYASDFAHQDGARAWLARLGLWQAGRRAQGATLFAHQEADRSRRAWCAALWQGARAQPLWRWGGFQSALAQWRLLRARFDGAVPAPPGVSRRPAPSPWLPCFDPLTVGRLIFSAPADGGAHLAFICDRHDSSGVLPGVAVPVRRAYFVLNSITIHRVDTGAQLHAHGFSASLDYQSWTWAWQASLHHDAAEHLGRDAQGGPAELAVVVNGVALRLCLERVTRDRRFNPTRWSVSGKGRALTLGAPYAPSMQFGNTAARTAQQLAADVLTINGVPIGWSVDWQLPDWPVPAGAWAMQGSYMDAVNDIAGAAGGYVQPHATEQVLRILPKYPAPPWDWGDVAVDFEIPAAAVEVEGTEFIDQPGYNRVFLGGIGAGVFGPFTRAGTAGNVLAPSVTHALMTDAAAHRQRGIAELANTGRQEHVTLAMQVLPETGVIVPGKFVRYLGGDRAVLGIVRSTAIDWSMPRLRQTIKLEAHPYV